MKTQDLILLSRWIRTNSLGICWYNNGQMWSRYEKKDGKLHGDSKSWRIDESLLYHRIWENGRVVKKIV